MEQHPEDYGTATDIQWKDMTTDQQRDWFNYIQTHWGEDLQGGYAKLLHPDPARKAKIDEEWA